MEMKNAWLMQHEKDIRKLMNDCAAYNMREPNVASVDFPKINMTLISAKAEIARLQSEVNRLTSENELLKSKSVDDTKKK